MDEKSKNLLPNLPEMHEDVERKKDEQEAVTQHKIDSLENEDRGCA